MKFSNQFSINELNEVQLYLHHAIQNIAAAGKYLLPPKDDDSHTNMTWHSKTHTFYGDSINNRARIGFNIPTFSLKIFGPTGLELAGFPLIGKSTSEAIIWVKQALQLKQIDTESLLAQMHYSIPEFPNSSENVFPKIRTTVLEELANHRSIADEICSRIFSQHSNATPPRTWPHHFDHGVYVPLEFDKEGNAIKSFGAGYAVADSIINEPYFYVTQWKKGDKVDYTNVPTLEHGTWHPEKLNGAALPLSEILEMENQDLGIKTFSETAITFSV